jgi:glucose-6-phosphate isomerase
MTGRTSAKIGAHLRSDSEDDRINISYIWEVSSFSTGQMPANFAKGISAQQSRMVMPSRLWRKMNDLLEPFATQIAFDTGAVSPNAKITRRYLQDMSTYYVDTVAVEHILNTEGNRLIYEVQAADLPEVEGQILYCTTTIYPGKIGAEYHMTKGHYHLKRDRAEVYLGTAGQGYLLLQQEGSAIRSIPMCTGTAAYVPANWAHRTVNTGDEPFIFFAAWPGDAGHDYGTIEQKGFAMALVEHLGKPTLINNPKHK